MAMKLAISSFILTMLFVLSACESSDDGKTRIVAPAVEPTTTEEAFVDATPKYLTTDCGSQAIEDTQPSADQATPTQLATNTIVKGRIDPNSEGNANHYWYITLDAGFYHVLLDESRVDGSDAELGLGLVTLAEGNSPLETLIISKAVDTRARHYKYLKVPNDGTLRLRLDAKHAAEDYLLGIFENGTSVPVPYMADCPTINELQFGTTQTIELGAATDQGSRERWYSVDLDAQNYIFTLDATRTDGVESNIRYSVLGYEQFGDSTRELSFVQVDDYGTASRRSKQLKFTQAIDLWIRVKNIFEPLSVSLSLTPQE